MNKEDRKDLVERLHVDARQLKTMMSHSRLAGPETGVRVCAPDVLLNDLTEAAAELDRLRRELEEAQEANKALRAKALEWLNAYKAESEVAKEERCKAFEEAAGIAENWKYPPVNTAHGIAAAIRQRAEEKP